jgi:glycerol dehydrogenase-like iron-containing ADH family enzyme
MTDENTQDSNSAESQLSPERENAAVLIANDFLGRATLGEALSQVSLNAVVQLAQNRAMQQAKDQVEKLTDEQVDELLEQAKKQAESTNQTAQEAVDEVSNETAEAS